MPPEVQQIIEALRIGDLDQGEALRGLERLVATGVITQETFQELQRTGQLSSRDVSPEGPGFLDRVRGVNDRALETIRGVVPDRLAGFLPGGQSVSAAGPQQPSRAPTGRTADTFFEDPFDAPDQPGAGPGDLPGAVGQTGVGTAPVAAQVPAPGGPVTLAGSLAAGGSSAGNSQFPYITLAMLRPFLSQGESMDSLLQRLDNPGGITWEGIARTYSPTYPNISPPGSAPNGPSGQSPGLPSSAVGPGGPSNIGDTGGNVSTTIPTATPGPVSAPTSFTDLLEQLGTGDITRRFALESGVAPSFRNLVQGRAERERLPFGINALINNQIPEGGSLDDLISTRNFEQFLNNQSGRSSLGDTLRSAGSFLGQDSGGNAGLGARQEAIRNRLFGGAANSGAIGSDRFSTLINLVANQGGQGRSVGGFNIGGAVNRSLQNVFANDPRRFEDAPEFINFLTQQGLI